jgi:hypothetical protein
MPTLILTKAPKIYDREKKPIQQILLENGYLPAEN